MCRVLDIVKAGGIERTKVNRGKSATNNERPGGKGDRSRGSCDGKGGQKRDGNGRHACKGNVRAGVGTAKAVCRPQRHHSDHTGKSTLEVSNRRKGRHISVWVRLSLLFSI